MSVSSGIATADDNDCKIIRLSTADYAPRDRSRASSGIFGQTLLRLDVELILGEPPYVEATLLRMPGLAMVVGRRSGTVYRRRREFIDHDGVSITWHSSSDCHAQQLRRTLDARGGQAIVLTGGEPGLLRVPTLDDYFHLSVPRSCLSTLITDLDDAYCRPIPAENPALQLLTRYISILQEAGTFAVPELRRQAVIHIHDLVALAIGATRDAAEIAKSRGARAVRLRTIKEDISTLLDQPGLSVATIAARHRIKPRWVQRLFESEGTTFTEYVLAQRLVRAHRVLTNPLYANQKVSTIALDIGFGDLSYFNRVFRRSYGITPSELRAAAKRPY